MWGAREFIPPLIQLPSLVILLISRISNLISLVRVCVCGCDVCSARGVRVVADVLLADSGGAERQTDLRGDGRARPTAARSAAARLRTACADARAGTRRSAHHAQHPRLRRQLLLQSQQPGASNLHFVVITFRTFSQHHLHSLFTFYRYS